MKVSYVKACGIVKIENKEDIKSLKTFCDMNAVRLVNKISEVKVGDFLEIPSFKTYVVKPFDTLEKISKKINVACEEIKQKNNIKNIFIGQIIKY